MSELLRKPYEISLWESTYATINDETHFVENKIMVIGSDTMTAPNRVYSPTLNIKNNGEKTLTFSLKYKYYDENVGDFVENPFAAYLVNERKVKLKYDNEWYEFLIKNHEETSEEYEFVYTAVDAFVNELSKVGYDLTFNTDLNNNQGTAVELGKEVVKDTDWIIDEEESDILRQMVAEAVYSATISASTSGVFKIKNLDTGEDDIVLNKDDKIYVFYSYVNNDSKQTSIQFIKQAEEYEVDDNNVIIATNYLIEGEVWVQEDWIGINNKSFCDLENLELSYKAYRLVYSTLTTYDPVMEHTVDRYQVNYANTKQDVYHYIDTDYTTSSIVTNYITNGNNFNSYGTGRATGWSNANSISTNQLPSIEITTFPSTDIKELVGLAKIGVVNSYLSCNLPVVNTENATDCIRNSIFNNGIIENFSAIGNISKGENYALRLRYKVKDGNSLRAAVPADGKLMAVIAKYDLTAEREISGEGKIQLRQIMSLDDIIFDFRNSTEIVANNIITGGKLINDNKLYTINDVIQTPSNQYVYMVDNDQYVWNADESRYVLKQNSNFVDYKLYKAAATKSIPESSIRNGDDRIGIFIFRIGGSAQTTNFYIEDIQVTKYITDAKDKIVLIGDAPEAKIISKDNFYLKPEEGMVKEEVNTYSSLESLADDLFISVDDITCLRNENYEKVLSISEDKSNCFNILQTICETFECWLQIIVPHDKWGRIKLDENGQPIKRLAFKEYIGKDNFAGFKYGINLSSIQRTINSEELVTKLIVSETASDYTPNGILSITDAKANLSGQSYIYNFDYYLNKGLIADRGQFEQDLANLNKALAENNRVYKKKATELTQLALAFEKARSSRNIVVEVYEDAQDKYTEALSKFELVTGQTYENFIARKQNIEEIDNTTQECINDIYAYVSILNSYSGIVTNVKEEFKKIDLRYNGAQTYGVTISTTDDGNGTCITKLVLSNYLEGFEFYFIDADGNFLPFVSDINKKEFVITGTSCCYYLVITKIPADYQIEYTYNNERQVLDISSPVRIEIYDRNNHKGKVIRYKLVPEETFAKSNRGIKQELNDLIEAKKLLEKDFFTKYSQFIQEGTWESTDYIDPELYYIDALQVSKTSAQPKVEYNINVVEVSQVEGYENYNFNVGDKTYIEDTDFFGYDTRTINNVVVQTPIREEVIVSEVEWHLDEPETNIITIQNYKTQFEDLFQRISATVQSVQYNQPSYARAASILDINGNINPSLLVNSLNAVSGQVIDLTNGGTIRATDEGLVIRNLTSSSNWLIIDDRGIKYSLDGGYNKTDLITVDGINVNALAAGQINTDKILIGNPEEPTFRWDSYGLSAYGYEPHGGYDLTTFVRFDKYGLYGIYQGGDYVVSSLVDIKDKAHFGLTWDGFFIKNSYTNGYVSISSDNDFQVVRNIDGVEHEKIKIGALDFNEIGIPTRYGINIKNDNDEVVFSTDDNGDLTMTGTIIAAAGHIGGMDVDNQRLLMDSIVLEPGIGIYSNINTPVGTTPIYDWIWVEPDPEIVDDEGHWEAIDTGEIETIYEPAFIISDTDGGATFNNANIRGTITALQGDFLGEVRVGPTDQGQEHIIIDGDNALIKSSNYQDGAGYGWMINKEGDAVFNNITARGAIKTAVFEYAEIQAVGGIFIFRPSSTIREAVIDDTDLIITVEKPYLFQPGSWCKISNYIDEGTDPDVRINNILLTNGLTHVYEVAAINGRVVRLSGAAAMVDGETKVVELESLIGGALIDMGNQANGSGEVGTHNYGIGINSSDNTVNLPARAISLFETVIDETRNPKVSYKYRGIFGTLPVLSVNDVNDNIYNHNMAGTQGVYTDNMYIGDNRNFIAYYYDKTANEYRMIINADTIYEGYDDDDNPIPITPGQDGEDGEDAITVRIDSSAGNIFLHKDITTTLTCSVIRGNGTDITNQVTRFTWIKKDANGVIDSTWSRPLAGRSITLTEADVDSKAIFVCEVEF